MELEERLNTMGLSLNPQDSEEEAQPELATDLEAGTEISEEEAQLQTATDSAADAEVSEETDRNQTPE
jgi:hypothetical protein